MSRQFYRDLLDEFHPTENGRALDWESDAVAWNKAWDRHLKRLWEIVLLPEGPLATRNLSRRDIKGGLSEQYGWYLLCEIRRLYRSQHNLSLAVNLVRARMDFEFVWLSLSVEQQKAHLLCGAIATFGRSGLEQRRSLCPELATKNLLRGGGRGYLNLMDTFCLPEGAPTHGTPVYLSHPMVDAISENLIYGGKKCLEEKVEVLLRRLMQETQLRRNIALTTFVDYTLRYISGEFSAANPPKFLHLKRGGDKAIARIWASSRGQEVRGEDTYKEDEETGSYVCARCDRVQDLAKERFLVCASCKTIERKVVYCGKACQSNDWEKGDPPHKSYCGKPMPPLFPIHLSSMSQAFASADMSVPPGAGDDEDDENDQKSHFVQSPALLAQVRMLQQDRHLAYVFKKAVNGEPVAMAYAEGCEPPEWKLFVAARAMAMTHGTPHAVADIHITVRPWILAQGLSPTRFLLQLRKEYGIPVEVLSKCVTDRESLSVEVRSRNYSL